MHFQIFIPGKHGADPEHLVDVGLASLARGASFQDSEGPEGTRGVLARWGKAEHYWAFIPDKQQWAPGPDKLYWVGYPTDSPPTEEELRRPCTLPGTPVELLTGHWLCPRHAELPREICLAEDGSIAFEMHRKFSAFHHEALAILQIAIGGGGSTPWPKAVKFARMGLDINYRMPAPLHLMLRLFDTTNVKLACQAMLGLEPAA